MLEGLLAVGWRKLHHAYGPAEDVPRLLHALISPDEKQRDEALYALHGNIWHQGTIYEATAHAVPFLWEILSGLEPCDRSGVAALIGLIAKGSGYRRFNPTPEETVWIANARAAVRKGLGIAETHLASKDVELRMLCVHILASFPEDAERFRPALRAALQREKDIDRRAGLGMAVMILGEPAPEAFASPEMTRLPLARLQEITQRAIDGHTERKNVLDFIFELSLTNIDINTILEWLDDPERWGGEDKD
ncbi:MAG TPA: hypothetical protein VMT98_06265 [Verrucomicrobiae bacterium]|nr:hypothetical protein [Verrucomicrobiae bacterium]